MPATYTNDGVSAGAISETTFVVTATPVPNSKEQCQPATTETSQDPGKHDCGPAPRDR